MSGVLIVAEHRQGEVLAVTHELIAAGLELSAAGAGDVRVVVIGADVAALAPAVGAAGVQEVIAVASATADLEPHITQRALAEVIEEVAPAVVLVGHTVDSFGFAPALAATSGLGFASNVLSVAWQDGALTARRGVYGDRLVADLAFDHDTNVVMVRPGAYAAAAQAEAPVRAASTDAEPVSTHRGYREPDTSGVDIAASEFLLSIGRGVGDEENVERFSQLADRLGATLSASRPLVDAGWISSARQVGQSGRTVKPKVYLALGISGAVQHLAGIRDAETVVAINTDPEAPIFGVAKYGATVDVFDLADALESHA